MHVRTLVIAVALPFTLSIAGTAQNQRTPQTQRSAPTRGTLSLEVTDRLGNALADVAVTVTGAVDRSGRTDAGGSLTLTALPAGMYRIRFEHERFITLERDVAV